MSAATEAEHLEYHYLHCCVGSLELGAIVGGRPPLSRRKLESMLAEMRGECPECRRLGWSGSEAMD